MAKDADAELVVGVDDRLTPALAKMAAQTRAFGQQWGVEASKIERATARVTRAVADMSQGAVIRKSPLAANIAATRAEMQKLAELSYMASRVKKTNTSFSGYTLDGKGIKAGQAEEILRSAEAYGKLETQLRHLTDTEARMARAQRANAFSQDQSKRFTIDPATLNASARSVQTLQKVYEGMWNDVDNAPKRWWPPEALRSTENFTKTIMEARNATRYVMYDVARNLAIGGAAAAAFGTVAVVAAARWEASFAQVERTTGATGAQLERIRQGLIGMSQDLPIAFDQLSEIAAVGAQMGIGADGIVSYTDVIAKLTATTNLTSDAAGKALGRFKAFFAEADDSSLAVTSETFGNLASSILKVGVNSVATETGIVNVGTQISSMGSYAGFTADQVIGLAGSLSSIGVPPELSRGVITRLFSNIGEAVSQNGTALQDFANIAGMTAEEFAASWGTDQFAYTFTDFISGLNNITQSGGDAVTTLHELGITSVRDVPVLLRLASAAGEAGTAGSLLAQTMNDARSGWRDNVELQLQYSKVSQTVSARAKVLLQNFEALFATMGQGALGPVKFLLDGLISVVKGLTLLASNPVGQWISGIGTVIFIVVGGLALLTAGAVRAGAAVLGMGQALTAMQVPLTTATALTRGLGIALGTLGGIAILALIIGTIVGLSTAAGDANNAIQDTQGALAALKKDTASGEGFFALRDGFEGAKDSAGKLTSQADNLSGVLNTTQDRLYGNADAANAAADATERTALQFGKSALAFSRASLVQQQAFTDLFGGNYGNKFADELVENNFDIDKALTVAAKDGRGAVERYMKEVYGGFKPFDYVEEGAAGYAEWSQLQANLIDQIASTGEGWQKVASSAYASGEAFGAVTSATQLTTDALEEFSVANEDAVNSMAGSYDKFVNSGSLISLTQQMNEALAVLDDGTTEVDEHAVAVQGFEKAWADAYGGAAFSIESYMVVFRRAAEEQQAFTANLQTLLARGLDSSIVQDLANMGPEAAKLVQALVVSTDAQLQEYEALYQQTGFDSMVALAAGQLAAQTIVQNAARTLSAAQLQTLSADLAAGTPLLDAMAKWNLDAEGNPMEAPAEVKMLPYRDGFQENLNSQRFTVPVTPYLTKSTLTTSGATGVGGAQLQMRMFAGGGFTGRGGMWNPAGVVHSGEFVHPKRDVDQRTGTPKPAALIRMLNGGRAARGGSGGGYATGGFVTPGAGSITYLSVEDRQLLIDIRNAIGLTITEGTLASATNASNTNATTRRVA